MVESLSFALNTVGVSSLGGTDLDLNLGVLKEGCGVCLEFKKCIFWEGFCVSRIGRGEGFEISA